MTEQPRITTESFREAKLRGTPIVVITAYDFNSASIADAAGVDAVLVGDSAAMTMLGYPSTRLVSVEEMLMLTRAARRGIRRALLVGDLPFGSYELSNEQAMTTARAFIDAGCDAVKLEGGSPAMVERISTLVANGIPVMGHVGLTPQSTGVGDRFRVHGRTADEALSILHEAAALDDAGCFSLVFEAIPARVTALLVPRLTVPVIGIGAGSSTDGQVLVFDDLVGLHAGPTPKFVRQFGRARAVIQSAVESYATQVRGHAFPAAEHTYGIDDSEIDKLRLGLDARAG